eukprot:TRINITY_DN31767_c0_g1_i1.p1 TRINITY_DN31767_c0_g1~~TRINITY_DN31767_c0_g1_i1.p1  ORF type:complete len:207 (-),score=27.87 TRINITY_DN31767_c0_g1_i1:481-1101(-)
MARPQSMTLLQEASFGKVGLSDAAEQRWQQLTHGKHLLESLYHPPQPDIHAPGCLVQRAESLSSTLFEDKHVFRSETCVQEDAAARSGPEQQSRQGLSIAHAHPTQQLLEELSHNHESPSLPDFLQRQINAQPFVPPDGEEWNMLNGFLVRMSRAEVDQLLARAEASESEEDGIDSEADTSIGFGSVCDHGASDLADESASEELEP